MESEPQPGCKNEEEPDGNQLRPFVESETDYSWSVAHHRQRQVERLAASDPQCYHYTVATTVGNVECVSGRSTNRYNYSLAHRPIVESTVSSTQSVEGCWHPFTDGLSLSFRSCPRTFVTPALHYSEHSIHPTMIQGSWVDWKWFSLKIVVTHFQYF